MGNIKACLLLVLLVPLLLPGYVGAAEEGTVQVGLTPNPLTVLITAPEEVEKDKFFTVRAQVGNVSGDRIRNCTAAIHLDNSGLRLRGQNEERRIGTIPPHQERNVVWVVEARREGNYVVLVTAEGQGTTGELTAQDSVMIEVKERYPWWHFFWRWWWRFFGR